MAVTALKVNDINIAAAPGQLIRFTVEGKWSPTCALKKSGYLADNGGTPLTGSDGFTLSTNEGRAVVTSVTDYTRKDTTHSHTMESRNCASASAQAGTPGGDQTGVGVKTELSASQCETKAKINSDSVGHSEDYTQSTEKRSTAQFTAGLRSAFAPFNDMPVGSLLAVQLKKNSILRKDIVAIEVVQNMTSLLVDQDVDLYLVVNDCYDPSSLESTTPALLVQYQVEEPASIAAVKLVNAMKLSIGTIDAQTEKVLAEGQLDGTLIDKLRAETQKIISDQGLTMDIPGGKVLNELFQYWIANELQSLQTKVHLKRLEREFKIENSVLSELENSILQAKNLESVFNLQKIWTINNFDIAQFRRTMSDSVAKLTHFIIPTIFFQEPGRIEMIRNSDEVTALRNLNLATPIEDIALKIKNLQSELIKTDTENKLKQRGWGEKIVGLSFVDPQLVYDSHFGLDASKQLSLWPKAPVLESEKIWKALRKSQDKETQALIFTVKPEDLYGRGELKMGCENVVSPVIEGMGLYFIVPDGVSGTNSDSYPLTTRLKAMGPLAFPQEDYLQNFELVGPNQHSWLSQEVPFNFGTGEQVTKVLERAKANTGVGTGGGIGLSPFMDFAINLQDLGLSEGGNFHSSINSIREIVLVFKIKYRQSNKTNLDWISTCKQ